MKVVPLSVSTSSTAAGFQCMYIETPFARGPHAGRTKCIFSLYLFWGDGELPLEMTLHQIALLEACADLPLCRGAHIALNSDLLWCDPCPEGLDNALMASVQPVCNPED